MPIVAPPPMLRDFWRDLTGVVHPADQAVLDARTHSFNLDYPPPAFIGDPDAPVVLRYANGGYSETVTPQEFEDPAAAARHRGHLHGIDATIPDYYRSHALGDWIEAGVAVRVNAVAYRSKSLSNEPANRSLAEFLPSLALHRKWVREVVLPEALAGRRFLIIHRNGMWRLDRSAACGTVVFSSNPVSPSPARATVERARVWLEGRLRS